MLKRLVDKIKGTHKPKSILRDTDLENEIF
jgi:hypothetical protein